MRLKIGVSSCLLGARVRYDGDDKRSAPVVDIVARHVELIPLCPEAESGLGVPRPAVRLVGDARFPRMLGVENPEWDVTQGMKTFSDNAAERLDDLAGYIFKSRSPSCGLRDVPVVDEQGARIAERAGIFAHTLMQRWPGLAVADENDIEDLACRAHFFEQAFAYERWRQFCRETVSPRALMQFHSAHKYALMAHGAQHYRILGRCVAYARRATLRDKLAEYGTQFFTALRAPSTRGHHTNVLQHIAGHFGNSASPDERRDIARDIDAYRRGDLELPQILAVLSRLNERYPDAFLTTQTYLYPSREERILRFDRSE